VSVALAAVQAIDPQLESLGRRACALMKHHDDALVKAVGQPSSTVPPSGD
jgi:hypothetical protein